MTVSRAALHLALEDDFVTTNFVWRSKLKPLKGMDRRRDLYLDIGQRRTFIAHAADDLAQFLRGMSLVPLRPGALAKLQVAHCPAPADPLRGQRQSRPGSAHRPAANNSQALQRALQGPARNGADFPSGRWQGLEQYRPISPMAVGLIACCPRVRLVPCATPFRSCDIPSQSP